MKTVIINDKEAVIVRDDSEPFRLYCSCGNIRALIDDFFSPRPDVGCLRLAAVSGEDTNIVDIKDIVDIEEFAKAG